MKTLKNTQWDSRSIKFQGIPIIMVSLHRYQASDPSPGIERRLNAVAFTVPGTIPHLYINLVCGNDAKFIMLSLFMWLS